MEILVVFLPLIAAAVAGFGRHVVGARGAEIITTAALCLCAVLAMMLFHQYAVLGQSVTLPVLEWVNSGSLHLSWALKFDVLTAVMVLVVTSVSAMVHLYAIGYMHEDPSRAKFMAYLSLFTFMMLMLVTADNFVQMFFGWEGVGLASYLLIGFWNHRPAANDAAMKAFIVNRVGDFGFVLGIFMVFFMFGSLQFTEVFNAAATLQEGRIFQLFGLSFDALTLCCVLLFIGAVGKSAQLGLHTWLPDAMEGPTPVSALIHAATMVTAGVFMLVRISPLLEAAPVARNIIIVVGALTAFVGACIAFAQFDIKKVIAYSTMSQLGYMIFAAGTKAYGAAIFHLFTHAFFKALLFLGAGAVIHAMHHEQDMRHYGGLYKKLPVTYVLMWIGTLALLGMPPFAGYFSKDMILEAEFAAHTLFGNFAFATGVLVAFMTAIYSSKVMFMTFHGRPRYDTEHAHDIHEAPLTMMIPLFVLAAGAVLAGMAGYDSFVGEHHKIFWETAINPEHQTVLEHAHHVPLWVKLAPTLAGLLGLGTGWLCYVREPDAPAWFAKKFAWANAIIENKFYFDRVYGAVFARGTPLLGKLLWRYGDQGVIDKFGPDGAAAVSGVIGARLSKFQTGFVYHYAFVMLMALVLLIGWLLFATPARAEELTMRGDSYVIASNWICCSGREEYRVPKKKIIGDEQVYALRALYNQGFGNGFDDDSSLEFKTKDLLYWSPYFSKLLGMDISNNVKALVQTLDRFKALEDKIALDAGKNEGMWGSLKQYKTRNFINAYLVEPPFPHDYEAVRKEYDAIQESRFAALKSITERFGIYSCDAIIGDDNWSCSDLATDRKWEEPLPDEMNVNKMEKQ